MPRAKLKIALVTRYSGKYSPHLHHCKALSRLERQLSYCHNSPIKCWIVRRGNAILANECCDWFRQHSCADRVVQMLFVSQLHNQALCS